MEFHKLILIALVGLSIIGAAPKRLCRDILSDEPQVMFEPDNFDALKTFLPIVFGKINASVEQDPRVLADMISWYAGYSAYVDRKKNRDLSYFESLRASSFGRSLDQLYEQRSRARSGGRPRPAVVPLEWREIDFSRAFSDAIVELGARFAKRLPLAQRIQLAALILRQSANSPVNRSESRDGLSFYEHYATYVIDTVVDALAGIDPEPQVGGLRSNYDQIGDALSVRIESYKYLSSYTDLVRLMDALDLKPGQTFSEIGAGRAAVVLGLLYPQVNCVVYEILSGRVRMFEKAIKSLGLENARIEKADVLASGFQLEPADFYYTYDPDSFDPIPKLKNQFIRIASKRAGPVILMTAPPRKLSRDEQGWLQRKRWRIVETRKKIGFYQIKKTR